MFFAVLLVATLSLICIAGVSAADAGISQIQTGNASAVQEKSNVQINSTDSINKSGTMQSLVDENTKTAGNTNSSTANTILSSSQVKAAAVTSFTMDQIKDAAARVKTFIETNKKLPNYVTIGTTQVSMPAFLKLLTKGLLQINSGTTTPIALKTVSAPSQPTESIKSGDIDKANYLDLATRVNTFIDANSRVPNYATSTLGKLRYENMVYMFSRIINFQKINNRLPNYVTVTPWGTTPPTPIPDELKKYLVATTNCQVNDPTIKSLAASITSGATSTYDKAATIFKWVNDHTSWSNYYNTKKGAVGTLNAKTGNCCDLSHLVIALTRAAGIPARYAHGNCHFSSGWCGHVWAQVWVNGKWYAADASSSSNTFGVITNWNTATYTLKGTYATLPF